MSKHAGAIGVQMEGTNLNFVPDFVFQLQFRSQLLKGPTLTIFVNVSVSPPQLHPPHHTHTHTHTHSQSPHSALLQTLRREPCLSCSLWPQFPKAFEGPHDVERVGWPMILRDHGAHELVLCEEQNL